MTDLSAGTSSGPKVSRSVLVERRLHTTQLLNSPGFSSVQQSLMHCIPGVICHTGVFETVRQHLRDKRLALVPILMSADQFGRRS